MEFSFVCDLNKKGAKSKPFKMSLDGIQDEIAISYDAEIGDGKPPHIHEQFTGHCIPYIDVDLVEGEGGVYFGTYEKYRKKKIKEIRKAVKQVFGDVNLILADRSGHSVKHNAYKLSLRAFIRGAGYFSCPPACGHFMMDKMKIEGIDLDAYKKRQNMGLVYNTKMGDNRILQLLDSKDNPIEWGKRVGKQSIIDTIIQNVEGEDNCLDGDWKQPDETPYHVVAHLGGDGDGIDRVLSAAKSLMPDLEIRKVMDNGEYQMIEFIKTSDECAICKRTHTGNRAYAISYPDRAFLKCHDQDAKDKKILLFHDCRDMLPESDDDDDDEPEPEYIDNTLELKLLRSDHQDEDYAEFFVAKFPDQFILYDNLFHYSDHTWKFCADDAVLYNFLGKKVYKALRCVLDDTFKDIEDAEHHARISKQLLILRSWKKRSGIVASIKAKIQVRSDPFDLNPNLVGFKNGVYDLETSEFRDGVPDDYVSKAVGYDYDDVSDDSIQKLMSFIDKIMPRVDERDCLMRGLASGLYGKTLQNLFILTGEGGNGKDTLVSKLYRDTIGRDYYEYSNTAILTEKKKGDLCQGVANMHKKRAIVWSEPPKQSILQGSVMKEVTGVDQVNARGLYSKNTTTLIMSSCFLLCNDIPRVDSVDGGLARRLLVIPFRSLFKMPDDIAKMTNTDNVYEADAYYDSQEFRDEFRLTFFHILLGYFMQFRDHGYMMKNIPKTIKDMSAQYLADSDDFLGWFNDVYEKADGEFVQLKDVWLHFKASDLYQNLNKAEKRVMNKKKMIENVIKNPSLKPYYTERCQHTVDGKQKNVRNALVGYRMKIDEISDDDE